MYVRNRVPVRGGVMVECTIVSAGSPIARSFLGDHVERRGPGTGGRADDPEL